ncbi:hypothetical protein ACJ7V3_13220 [Halomonas elongata]
MINGRRWYLWHGPFHHRGHRTTTVRIRR